VEILCFLLLYAHCQQTFAMSSGAFCYHYQGQIASKTGSTKWVALLLIALQPEARRPK
jgi:hypothetical protein